MGRAPCCDKANVKKGPWSPDEDAKLKSYIEQHGTGGNWIALPHKIGLRRCGKSCRLRWLNYLRPNLKHGGFSEEEDSIICGLYVAIGSRWSVIASQLPGRTDNDVKNYWNTRLKKKLLGMQRKQEPDSNESTPKQAAAVTDQDQRNADFFSNHREQICWTPPFAAMAPSMNASIEDDLLPPWLQENTSLNASIEDDLLPPLLQENTSLNAHQGLQYRCPPGHGDEDEGLEILGLDPVKREGETDQLRYNGLNNINAGEAVQMQANYFDQGMQQYYYCLFQEQVDN